MTQNSHLHRIKQRITYSSPGSIFIISDFLDVADMNTVSSSMSRLEKSGFVRRVLRGVYEYPRYSSLLEEYVAPQPKAIADAIARNNGWTIAPGGDAVLNLMGLSTQVPAVWEFVSDGPYKTYRYNNTTLQFKHTSQKNISKISEMSALIIQAMRALGRENINNRNLEQISKNLTAKEMQALLKEAQYSTAWVYEYIKRLTNHGVYDGTHRKKIS